MTHPRRFQYTLAVIASVAGVSPALVIAATGSIDMPFTPLSPALPLIGEQWYQGGFNGLLNALLGASVAIAAVLAVVMVAIGGFKYMTTDSMFQISGAKEQISNAIIGLLIVLASILILSTINPNIVSLRIFDTSYSSGGTTAAPQP